MKVYTLISSKFMWTFQIISFLVLSILSASIFAVAMLTLVSIGLGQDDNCGYYYYYYNCSNVSNCVKSWYVFY